MVMKELLSFKDWMDTQLGNMPLAKHIFWYSRKKMFKIPSVIGGIICGTLAWLTHYYNSHWSMGGALLYSILVGAISIPIIFRILVAILICIISPLEADIPKELKYFKRHKLDANLYQYLRITDVFAVLFGVIEAGDVMTLTEVLRKLFDLPYNKDGTKETIVMVPNAIRDTINDVVKIPFNVMDLDAPAIKDDCDIKTILTNIGNQIHLVRNFIIIRSWLKF